MGTKKSAIVGEAGCTVQVIHEERVIRARQELAPDYQVQRLSLLYKVLGDTTRLKITMALKEGEMCVCDLAALLGISESAVSHQLRRLKDLALVKNRREGPCLYYCLDDRHVEDLIQLGIEHISE